MNEANRTNSAPASDSTGSGPVSVPVSHVYRGSDAQISAVVVFRKQTTMEEAKELLSRVSDHMNAVQIIEFDPFFGPPVLYQP